MSKSQEEKFIEFYEKKIKEDQKRDHDKGLSGWHKPPKILISFLNCFKNFGKSIGIEFYNQNNYWNNSNNFCFSLDDEDLEYLYKKYKVIAEQHRCKRIDKEIKVTEENIKRFKKDLKKLLKQKC